MYAIGARAAEKRARYRASISLPGESNPRRALSRSHDDRRKQKNRPRKRREGSGDDPPGARRENRLTGDGKETGGNEAEKLPRYATRPRDYRGSTSIDHHLGMKGSLLPAEEKRTTVLTKGARGTGLASSTLLIAPRLARCTPPISDEQMARNVHACVRCYVDGEGGEGGERTHAWRGWKRGWNSGWSDRGRKIDRVALQVVSPAFA